MYTSTVDIDREFTRNRGYNPAFMQAARDAAVRRAIEDAHRAEEERAKDILRQRGVPLWVRDIILDAAKEHGVSPVAVVTSNVRRVPIVEARWKAIHRIKTAKPVLSSLQISRWFGQNHTATLYALARYAEMHGGPTLTGYDIVRRRARRAERLAGSVR